MPRSNQSEGNRVQRAAPVLNWTKWRQGWMLPLQPMKKVAWIFGSAVFAPSLVLAWLAIRSLQDQQFVLERQRALLYQEVVLGLAKEINSFFSDRQREFDLQVEAMLARQQNRAALAAQFDEQLRPAWPWAQVGFVVSMDGTVMAPSAQSRPEASGFLAENGLFLSNRQTLEVYNNLKSPANFPGPSLPPETAQVPGQQAQALQQRAQPFGKGQMIQRKVTPQLDPQNIDMNYSRLAFAEGGLRQLIGEATEGTWARFVQNQLRLLMWYRPPNDSQLIFGAQLDVARITEGLRNLIPENSVTEPARGQAHQRLARSGSAPAAEICVALLDDTGQRVAVSHPDFHTDWRRPFVSTEIGEILPHWEIGAYLLDPAQLIESATVVRLTLGMLIAMLLVAIGVGGWLVVVDLHRELNLARQKTDFVSNVSHELKTPLTSIRMFSELLAEGRVSDPAKQRAYLAIITAEASRLTRLINNVLDFARLERGEKKYQFQVDDLAEVTRQALEAFRPHLEANGFRLTNCLPETALPIRGDRDALAQILINLLSNAEKYSGAAKDIAVEARLLPGPLPAVEVTVGDRGPGVPTGCEEKIFEKFYRAHDALASGIPGSGLGLTLARQIARAHGGEVVYRPREGGGSCFALRLPLVRAHDTADAAKSA